MVDAGAGRHTPSVRSLLRTLDELCANPSTVDAMALASAYRSLGRSADAATLIRHWWRDKAFDADAQRAMLTELRDGLWSTL